MIRNIKSAFLVFIMLSILTGLVYPFFVTGLAQLVFPAQANGSLMKQEGKPAGSELIGQSFDDPKYFWGRLSSTPDFPYNSGSSSGSNLGPSNPALAEAVEARVSALRAADPDNKDPIPVDLVTSSGSGLDPHVSPEAALYQVPRVARARGIPEEQVRSLVDQFTEARQFGFLGEPRVNVLKLNLALNSLRSD